MKLPFHLVLECAQRKKDLVRQALLEFFLETDRPTPDQESDAFPLFMEWLIFDYRTPEGSSFLAKYLAQNPDNLSKLQLSRLRQVAKTQFYAAFEICQVKRHQWLKLEQLFSGQKFKVYDKKSTSTIPKKGTLHARIAEIEKKWYFVGSNPVYFSLTFTPRMKKMFRRAQPSFISSPKQTWQMIANRGKVGLPPKLSLKEIAKKREALCLAYQSLVQNYPQAPAFAQILSAIHKEKCVSPADIFKECINQGLSEKVFASHLQLFEDIWNFFPHKVLNGESPVEMFQKLKSKESKG